jgi:hypothetical protein
MLQKALDNVLKESHSSVLRRSAGIPPTIIAILRAEPERLRLIRKHNNKRGNEQKSDEPVLINMAIRFLLDLAKTGTQDSKIHALNIMKFVFSDGFLKAEFGQFIPQAMTLAIEDFRSDSWPIRNSALMCFTALIKRLLGTNQI